MQVYEGRNERTNERTNKQTNKQTYTTTKHITTLLLRSRVKMYCPSHILHFILHDNLHYGSSTDSIIKDRIGLILHMVTIRCNS